MTVEMSILGPVATRRPAGRRASTLLRPAVRTALIGGVSVYGGRGGFIGVILGVGLVVVLNSGMPFGDAGSVGVHLGFVAATISIGLLVSWAIGLIAPAIDAQPGAPPTVASPTVVLPVVAWPAVSSAAGVAEHARGLV
jgi:hypothetical protein